MDVNTTCRRIMSTISMKLRTEFAHGMKEELNIDNQGHTRDQSEEHENRYDFEESLERKPKGIAL